MPDGHPLVHHVDAWTERTTTRSGGSTHRRRRDRGDMTGSEPARVSASEPQVPERVDALLVPLDGSDFSRVAVPIAARLAARLGAENHLLSAVESVD